MLKLITKPISKILKLFGYQISQTYDLIPPTKEIYWIRKLGIKTIIDIGSNEGQFILKISKYLPEARIYAFEPIKECFGKLVINTRHLRVKAFNMGLSNEAKYAEINISNNTESSSLMEMKNLHVKNYPKSVFINKETIELKRLDDIFTATDLEETILIKLDVQGHEQNVIDGGAETIKRASVLLIESIFEPLYEKQWLFDDIYNYCTDAGFKFMGFTEQEYSSKTGIPLFADAIFVKKELVPLLY